VWVWWGRRAGVVVLGVAPPRQELQRRVAPTVLARQAAVSTVVADSFDPLASLRAAYRMIDAGATATISSLAQHVPRTLAIGFGATWAVGSAMLLALFVAVNV